MGVKEPGEEDKKSHSLCNCIIKQWRHNFKNIKQNRSVVLHSASLAPQEELKLAQYKCSFCWTCLWPQAQN